MAERPLLLFPTPERADRTKQTSSRGQVRKPDIARQGARLSPMFTQLQLAFNNRRIELQQNTSGIDPEQVLVFETVGTIDKFANAIKRIEGLEWMGEIESDEIAPDQDFYDESTPQKELSGRLYLIMANQKALDEMLSLWRRYQADQGMKFEHGLTKFRDVFLWLKSIRRWDVQDRLLETGVIDVWRKNLELDGNRVVQFETELWFRRSAGQRQASADRVKDLVQSLGGRIICQSTIDEIAYHSLLAELPASAIRSIITDSTIELVKCDEVLFFRPTGQMTAGDKPSEGVTGTATIEERQLPNGDPIIALLDGVPLVNHYLLTGRVQVDDPDNFEEEYTASERIHGTSMASLIIHGDINETTTPLGRPIYIRPIMKPIPWPTSPRPEVLPENCLPLDLIHRAVKRMFEGEQGGMPIAPQIRIINLSIGDKGRPFTQSISPLARLLDMLSVKYGVLFVVSAGNHSEPISLGISRNDFDALRPGQRETDIIRTIYGDARNRRLLSPAESINGLTVGAIHDDATRAVSIGDRFDPFEHELPSPISAFGSGYRRAIKPDLLNVGGKQLYRHPYQSTERITIEPAIFRSAPGIKSASPGSQSGDLSATAHSCGTSNATALISRAAGICYDSLLQIFSEQATDIDSRNYEVPLLKTMLVHGCSWAGIGERISDVLRTGENSRQLTGLISRWLGYGIPQIERVLDCTNQRATLLGFGQLEDDEAHVYRLPLPPSLGSRSVRRRLIVTLAWLSPIAPNTQKYRTASLWFEVGGISVAQDRKDGCSGSEGWRAVRRGTVQHEVFEGQRAEPFVDGDGITIKINCREDAGKIQNPIAYGLAVTFEVGEGVDIAVYDEIRTRITPAIQIQQETNRDRG